MRRLLPLLAIVCLSTWPSQPAAAQQPRSLLLGELDAIAQRQLRGRGDAVAAIRERTAAEARQKEVRARILSLIGGLPDFHGPLNPRVTRTTPRDGFTIHHVLF